MYQLVVLILRPVRHQLIHVIIKAVHLIDVGQVDEFGLGEELALEVYVEVTENIMKPVPEMLLNKILHSPLQPRLQLVKKLALLNDCLIVHEFLDVEVADHVDDGFGQKLRPSLIDLKKPIVNILLTLLNQISFLKPIENGLNYSTHPTKQTNANHCDNDLQNHFNLGVPFDVAVANGREGREDPVDRADVEAEVVGLLDSVVDVADDPPVVDTPLL